MSWRTSVSSRTWIQNRQEYSQRATFRLRPPSYRKQHLVFLGGLSFQYLFIYLFGDLTGVAASKWHMTPKKNQANNYKHANRRSWCKKFREQTKNKLQKTHQENFRKTKCITVTNANRRSWCIKNKAKTTTLDKEVTNQ